MTVAAEVRQLVKGDEARLFELLERHVDSSLFFFSNVERAGLEDRGYAFQATYFAHFEAGVMTAVAGHAWNGNLMVQGDSGLEQAVVAAVAASGRALRGMVGPWALVCRARAALSVLGLEAQHDGREVLMSLLLSDLQVPSLLDRPNVVVRSPTEAEAVGVLGAWRADYQVETLGAAPGVELAKSARDQMVAWRAAGTLWVLAVDHVVVAMSGFNAVARGIVQVGGVFTPPAQRSRGYARAVVAASLRLAREAGATRSVLFTAEQNQAAQRVYTSLGYRPTGDFGLVLF